MERKDMQCFHTFQIEAKQKFLSTNLVLTIIIINIFNESSR